MMFVSRKRDHRFCAFCRSHRRVYLKKHVDLTNVLAALVFTVAANSVIFGSFDPRGVFFFVAGLSLGEIFVHLRWRASIVCKLCGFDPVLYKKAPNLAAQAVRRFFEAKIDDPRFILSNSPLLEVRRRMREQERKRQTMENVATRTSLGQSRKPVIDHRV